MLSKILFTINAAVCAGPGVVLLVAPNDLMAAYGVTLDTRGEFMGRLLGSALAGLALFFWRARDTTDATMRTTVTWVGVLVNLLQAAIISVGVNNGLLNALGWPALLLHLLLALLLVLSTRRRDVI